MGCEKCQGLRKGEKIVRMCPIIVLEVDREPLDEIIRHPFREIPRSIDQQYGVFLYVPETVLEGFPDLTSKQFVDGFCDMNGCEPETEVTRILFDYIGRVT